MLTRNSCLECNNLLFGRTDKKFCSEPCRNSFNNKKRANERLLIRNIDKKLHRNRFILKNHYAIGKTKISRLVLQFEGFDFNHFTHYLKKEDEITWCCCYEYNYCFIKKDEWVIISNESNVEKPVLQLLPLSERMTI